MPEFDIHRDLQKAIAPLATRRELESWSGLLTARMAAQLETFQLHMETMRRNIETLQRDLRRDLDNLRFELQTDLERHANAIARGSSS